MNLNLRVVMMTVQLILQLIHFENKFLSISRKVVYTNAKIKAATLSFIINNHYYGCAVNWS